MDWKDDLHGVTRIKGLVCGEAPFDDFDDKKALKPLQGLVSVLLFGTKLDCSPASLIQGGVIEDRRSLRAPQRCEEGEVAVGQKRFNEGAEKLLKWIALFENQDHARMPICPEMGLTEAGL